MMETQEFIEKVASDLNKGAAAIRECEYLKKLIGLILTKNYKGRMEISEEEYRTWIQGDNKCTITFKTQTVRVKPLEEGKCPFEKLVIEVNP